MARHLICFSTLLTCTRLQVFRLATLLMHCFVIYKKACQATGPVLYTCQCELSKEHLHLEGRPTTKPQRSRGIAAEGKACSLCKMSFSPHRKCSSAMEKAWDHTTELQVWRAFWQAELHQRVFIHSLWKMTRRPGGLGWEA